ncbi:MAG: peptidoglycan-associated lipoprotein Pal [Deltaproteobacteria bacterium]|nr:peptidoglycan-associated lipoprotein Pal [Deltaproteobacteria bacterium]
MRKKNWVVGIIMFGLMVLLALSGCARNKAAVKAETTSPSAEQQAATATKGIQESDVLTEEIQPIQPKEMADVYFAYDRFDLSPEARSTLADNAAWMENHAGTTVVIEGHCDDRGSSQYNLALGDRRAKSAYNYLINLGVAADRISTISYGEEKPVCTEQTESCWSRNRRVHFRTR